MASGRVDSLPPTAEQLESPWSRPGCGPSAAIAQQAPRRNTGSGRPARDSSPELSWCKTRAASAAKSLHQLARQAHNSPTLLESDSALAKVTPKPLATTFAATPPPCDSSLSPVKSFADLGGHEASARRDPSISSPVEVRLSAAKLQRRLYMEPMVAPIGRSAAQPAHATSHNPKQVDQLRQTPETLPNNTLIVDLIECHANLAQIWPQPIEKFQPNEHPDHEAQQQAQQQLKEQQLADKPPASGKRPKCNFQMPAQLTKSNLGVSRRNAINLRASQGCPALTGTFSAQTKRPNRHHSEQLAEEDYNEALSVLRGDVRFKLHVLLYRRLQAFWTLATTFLCLALPLTLLGHLEVLALVAISLGWLAIQLMGYLLTGFARRKLDDMLERSVAQANAFFMDHNLMLGVLNAGGILSKSKFTVPMLYFDTTQCREQIESIISIDSRNDAACKDDERQGNNKRILDYSRIDLPLTKPNVALALAQSQLAKKIVLRYSQRWISYFDKRKLMFTDDETWPRHLSTGKCLCQFIEEQFRTSEGVRLERSGLIAQLGSTQKDQLTNMIQTRVTDTTTTTTTTTATITTTAMEATRASASPEPKLNASPQCNLVASQTGGIKLDIDDSRNIHHQSEKQNFQDIPVRQLNEQLHKHAEGRRPGSLTGPNQSDANVATIFQSNLRATTLSSRPGSAKLVSINVNQSLSDESKSEFVVVDGFTSMSCDDGRQAAKQILSSPQTSHYRHEQQQQQQKHRHYHNDQRNSQLTSDQTAFEQPVARQASKTLAQRTLPAIGIRIGASNQSATAPVSISQSPGNSLDFTNSNAAESIIPSDELVRKLRLLLESRKHELQGLDASLFSDLLFKASRQQQFAANYLDYSHDSGIDEQSGKCLVDNENNFVVGHGTKTTNALVSSNINNDSTGSTSSIKSVDDVEKGIGHSVKTKVGRKLFGHKDSLFLFAGSNSDKTQQHHHHHHHHHQQQRQRQRQRPTTKSRTLEIC